ncbi:MAG: hypothetical protein PF480_05215 [Roseovarius sp.]|jgi:hypothetical protein|nr:hypothetical protein [Roseovarius sp.]
MQSDNLREKIEVLHSFKEEMWKYYVRTQDLRKEVFDFYFKTVAIPVPLVAGFLLWARSNEGRPPISSEAEVGIFALLFAFVILGFVAFLHFCLETKNSQRYLEDIKTLQKRVLMLVGENPNSGFLGIPEHTQIKGRYNLGKFSVLPRALMIAIPNLGFFSFLISLCVPLTCAILLFVVLVVFHILIYQKIVSVPSSSSSKNANSDNERNA